MWLKILSTNCIWAICDQQMLLSKSENPSIYTSVSLCLSRGTVHPGQHTNLSHGTVKNNVGIDLDLEKAWELRWLVN